MTTVTFQEVSVYAKKSGKCACGKYRTRSKKITQTINPFNKNPDGTVKNYQEVMADVSKESREWKQEPITCDSCPLSE